MTDDRPQVFQLSESEWTETTGQPLPYRGDRGDGLPTHWTGVDAWPWPDKGCRIRWEWIQRLKDAGFDGDGVYQALINKAIQVRDEENDKVFSQELACHALVALNFLEKL